MSSSPLPEVWLRGPLTGVPPLLQPVAHALLQAREEVEALMADFPQALLWQRPALVASVGFHLQHLTGVLDRIFTYASGKALSLEQMRALSVEGVADDAIQVADLVHAFHQQVDKALLQLSQTEESTLTDFRGVGRAQLPSTVTGLLTHAAEHTMRHTGQLLVTARILRG
jgi:uncharacterized damage-inducible protein DinB